MNDDFLGTGWKFPISTNKLGQTALCSSDNKIRESILIILGTAKGERVMRPDFGCDIHEYTFDVANTSTLTLINSAVKEALIRFEPRIDILNVESLTDHIEHGILNIQLDYKVRATNTEANLVYPFYLKADGE